MWPRVVGRECLHVDEPTADQRICSAAGRTRRGRVGDGQCGGGDVSVGAARRCRQTRRSRRPPVRIAVMTLDDATARSWLAVAVEEARAGLAEGGIPIGAALIGADGT